MSSSRATCAIGTPRAAACAASSTRFYFPEFAFPEFAFLGTGSHGFPTRGFSPKCRPVAATMHDPPTHDASMHPPAGLVWRSPLLRAHAWGMLIGAWNRLFWPGFHAPKWISPGAIRSRRPRRWARTAAAMHDSSAHGSSAHAPPTHDSPAVAHPAVLARPPLSVHRPSRQLSRQP